MIQRIQTVWLLLSAIVVAGLFVFDYYNITSHTDVQRGGIGNNFVGIVLLSASIVLSFVTIFKYKSLNAQLSFIWLNILLLIGLLAWLQYDITDIQKTHSGTYWVGAFLPLVSIIFQLMARSGIRKDRKLLKSLDRLR